MEFQDRGAYIVYVLLAGLVPERPRKMAAHGVEAGGEVGQVRRERGQRFPRRP